jgi:phosphate acyltransferase
VKIGIDLLGSENAPEALLKAAYDLTQSFSFTLHTFGQKIPGYDSVVWHETAHQVLMSDIGVKAASSHETSMYIGLKALQEGLIDAFISCGNTAALLTYTHLLIPKLPGVKRAGLLAKLGTKNNSCYVIDVGANLNLSALQLQQFALIGSATHRALKDEEAKIGILNIACEKGKGPEHLKKLYSLMENNPHFVGYVEPKDVFEGKCHLVITDGFTGNILLKTAEAVAQMTLGSKISETEYDPSSYPGALLCGAEKLVMKCHGVGDTRALQKTIEEVLRLNSRNYLTRVKQEISALGDNPL